MLRLHTFCFLVLLMFLVGCGKNVPLKGTITFSDDGSPLPEGTIAFVNTKENRMSRGDVRDGKFVIGTEKLTNGLPPGIYQISIDATSSYVDESTGRTIETRRIDPKYEDIATSGLSLEVNASTKVYNIQVDRFVP